MPEIYRIPDEPAPSHLTRYAVNPLFPFLSFMFLGLWFAWPWFAFNAYAVGSPTRRLEVAWLGIGLVAIFILVSTILYLVGAGILPKGAIPYIGIPVIVAKIAVLYAVFVLQARTIEIYEYYGGELQKGAWKVLIFAYLAQRLVSRQVAEDSIPFLLIWVLA